MLTHAIIQSTELKILIGKLTYIYLYWLIFPQCTQSVVYYVYSTLPIDFLNECIIIDRDHDCFIDLSEINAILRGTRRTHSLAKRPVTDSEKIEQEVRGYSAGVWGRSRNSREWKIIAFLMMSSLYPCMCIFIRIYIMMKRGG